MRGKVVGRVGPRISQSDKVPDHDGEVTLATWLRIRPSQPFDKHLEATMSFTTGTIAFEAGCSSETALAKKHVVPRRDMGDKLRACAIRSQAETESLFAGG